MGLLFLSHHRGDLVAVVEIVTQRVEHLGLGQSQGFGDFRNRFPMQMQSRDMANSNAEAVHDRLPAAYALKSDNVRMFGPDRIGHLKPLRQESTDS